MYKRLLILTLIALIALIPFAGASAADPEIGSKDDNACNAGGAMAGKCDTEWEWICGWYLARYNSKTFSTLISACSSLLPPPPAASAPLQSFPICYIGTLIHDLVQTGPINTYANGHYTTGTMNNCNDPFNIGWTLVQAPNGPAADALASALKGGASMCTNASGVGIIGVPADLYFCSL